MRTDLLLSMFAYARVSAASFAEAREGQVTAGKKDGHIAHLMAVCGEQLSYARVRTASQLEQRAAALSQAEAAAARAEERAALAEAAAAKAAEGGDGRRSPAGGPGGPRS